MKLIAEKRSKADKYDVLRFVRNNGTRTDAANPQVETEAVQAEAIQHPLAGVQPAAGVIT